MNRNGSVCQIGFAPGSIRVDNGCNNNHRGIESTHQCKWRPPMANSKPKNDFKFTFFNQQNEEEEEEEEEKEEKEE